MPETSIDFSAIRSRLAANSTETKSKLYTPFPLRAFLLLYTKAEHDCYINYMEGAKVLADWLAPIEFPDFTSIDDKYNVPSLLGGYSSDKLAEILAGSTLAIGDSTEVRANKLAKKERAKRAILVSMFREVLPELY